MSLELEKRQINNMNQTYYMFLGLIINNSLAYSLCKLNYLIPLWWK